MNRRIYIFFLIVFIIIASFVTSRRQRENFDIFSDVSNAVRDIGNLGGQITNTINSIPGIAGKLADSALDIALAPGKAAISEVNTVISNVERDITNLFKIIEEVFNKLKYFGELLIFLLTRAVKCAKGAERVTKNYKIRTEGKLRDIKALYDKLQTCRKNPIKIPLTYWRNCITQIAPFMKALYEFTEILIRFYQEILTYDELFPQGTAKKQYCATAWKTLSNQTQALNYGKRCNACLHLKSIMKLGLEELQEFAKVVNTVFKVTKSIETKINELGNIIKI